MGIVIGLPSYNEAGTVATVTRTLDQGARRLSRQAEIILVNADNGSASILDGDNLKSEINRNIVWNSDVTITAGPAPGAAVVTLGAPELLGTEYNISGEE